MAFFDIIMESYHSEYIQEHCEQVVNEALNIKIDYKKMEKDPEYARKILDKINQLSNDDYTKLSPVELILSVLSVVLCLTIVLIPLGMACMKIVDKLAGNMRGRCREEDLKKIKEKIKQVIGKLKKEKDQQTNESKKKRLQDMIDKYQAILDDDWAYHSTEEAKKGIKQFFEEELDRLNKDKTLLNNIRKDFNKIIEIGEHDTDALYSVLLNDIPIKSLKELMGKYYDKSEKFEFKFFVVKEQDDRLYINIAGSESPDIIKCNKYTTKVMRDLIKKITEDQNFKQIINNTKTHYNCTSDNFDMLITFYLKK